MMVLQEGDKVGLYIQLSDKQVVDPVMGRVHTGRISLCLYLANHSPFICRQ